jgi:hypothetical protein
MKKNRFFVTMAVLIEVLLVLLLPCDSVPSQTRFEQNNLKPAFCTFFNPRPHAIFDDSRMRPCMPFFSSPFKEWQQALPAPMMRGEVDIVSFRLGIIFEHFPPSNSKQSQDDFPRSQANCCVMRQGEPGQLRPTP